MLACLQVANDTRTKKKELYDIEADTFLIRWDVLASRAGGA